MTQITACGKEIFLVGTAHVSRRSAELVREVIEKIQPDTVCVELDERRHRAISQRQRWENLDIKKVIRQKELPTLITNLILSAYQKRLGERMGVMPGAELAQAVKTAQELGAQVALCDRDIRITLLRAWRMTPFLKKGKLFFSLIESLFDDTDLEEEDLERLKKSDVLSELMAELGSAMPEMKKVLIDERDLYLATKIIEAPGDRLVAVVGAGHVVGIIRTIRAIDEKATRQEASATNAHGKEPILHKDGRGGLRSSRGCQGAANNLAEIEEIPPGSPVNKVVAWAIPILIIGSMIAIGLNKGGVAAGENLLYWILANGISCAIGAAAALAHPLTVAAAFVAAPITSLTPLIGAGYVTAFVQAMAAPPLVREIEGAGKDMTRLSGWWQNRLLRVFLAFLLPGIGSMVGTWLGGYKIVATLFG